MEIKKKYLEKYLFDIAKDQLVDEYRKQGYHVSEQKKIGDFEPDLIFSKDKEVIVVEIKAGTLSPKKKEILAQLSNYVRNLQDAKFHVALVTPPKYRILRFPTSRCFSLILF